MKSIDIKGVRIGEGRPKTIVSLMAADSGELVREAARLTVDGVRGMPDCIEWRADFWHGPSPDALAGTCLFLGEELDRRPLIFTFRTKGQGGQVALKPQAYADICQAVIEQGEPDVVDIELEAGDTLVRELAAAAHEHGVHTLVSQHDFLATPDAGQMVETFLAMADLGADICKLAVMARDVRDCERLMEATQEAHRQLGPGRDRPFCSIAMGEAGRRSRLEGERFGSALTFCALGTSSAPGQVELREAVRVMDELHAKLAG